MTEGISVSATVEETLPAIRATLLATVQGASLVKADRAATASREVVTLTETLVRAGLSRDAVSVLGVVTENRIGVARSAAAFRVKIRIDDLTLLEPVVDVVAETRGAALDSLEWGYDDTDARRDARLAAAIQVARRRAHSAATALGVGLGRIRHCEEVSETPGVSFSYTMGAADSVARGAGAALSSPEVAPERTVTTTVRTVWAVADAS